MDYHSEGKCVDIDMRQKTFTQVPGQDVQQRLIAPRPKITTNRSIINLVTKSCDTQQLRIRPACEQHFIVCDAMELGCSFAPSSSSRWEMTPCERRWAPMQSWWCNSLSAADVCDSCLGSCPQRQGPHLIAAVASP